MSNFRLPLRDEPWPVGDNGWHTCPVCGRPWRPWAGSLLPCHGKCLLTERAQDDLLDYAVDESTEPLARIAERLGLTLAVVRSSIIAAKRRRRARAA